MIIIQNWLFTKNEKYYDLEIHRDNAIVDSLKWDFLQSIYFIQMNEINLKLFCESKNKNINVYSKNWTYDHVKRSQFWL